MDTTQSAYTQFHLFTAGSQLWTQHSLNTHRFTYLQLAQSCRLNTVWIYTDSPSYSWLRAADSIQSEHTLIHLFTAGSQLWTQHSPNTHRFTYLQLGHSCRLNTVWIHTDSPIYTTQSEYTQIHLFTQHSLNTHRFTYLHNTVWIHTGLSIYSWLTALDTTQSEDSFTYLQLWTQHSWIRNSLNYLLWHYLKLALIWLLLLVQPLYLQVKVKSFKLYSRRRESLDVTRICEKENRNGPFEVRSIHS